MALSDDLRERVVHAVTHSGMCVTRRPSVLASVSPAPFDVAALRATGEISPARRWRSPVASIERTRLSARSGSPAADMTLLEIQERLIDVDAGDAYASASARPLQDDTFVAACAFQVSWRKSFR